MPSGRTSPNHGDVMFARAGSELITSSVVDGTVTALDIDTGQQRPIGSVRALRRTGPTWTTT